MNEYDDILAGNPDQQRLRATMYGATAVNPDAYAEARRLGRATGVPADVAARNPEDVKRKALLNEYDGLLGTAPALAGKYGSDPEFAKLAHDDAASLAAIEQSFRAAQAQGRAVRGQVGEAFQRPDGLRSSSGRVGETFIRRGNLQGEERGFVGGITEPVRRGLAQGDRGLTLLLSEMGVLQSSPADLGVRLATQQRQVERFPIPPALQAGMESISGAETMGTAATQILLNPRAVLEVSLQSIGSSAPALVGAAAGSIAGPLGTATGAGLGSFAVEYAATIQDVIGEAGIDGKDADAMRRALSNPELMAAAREKAVKRGIPIAIFDALTAGVAGRILAGAKKATSSIAPRIAGELGVQAGSGATGEAVAQAATGEYKPGDILLEALAEMPSALVEVPANFRSAQARAQQAEQRAQQAEQVQQLAEASKLKARDPEAFRAFIEQVAAGGDGPAELFIDAQQLANTLNQSAITMQELQAIAPTVAQQMAAGVVPGADIRVPVAEFAAAPADITTALLDHLRETPDAMSRAEAQEFIKQQGERIQQDVQTAIAGQQRESEFQASVEKVRTHFEEQLTAVGKFRPEVNRAYATMLGNFYATQAERAGMSVDEFMERYRLQVTAKDRQQDARMGRLEQAAASIEALRGQMEAAGIDASMHESDGVITLSKIVVPEDQRGAGKGTAAMQALVDYADATGQHVALSPSADFGGNKKRLVQFYKRFGFVENKSRNRAFTISEAMYRPAASGGKVLYQGPRASLTFANDITSVPSIIALLENADLSSFLHESGHLFLEVQGDLAARIVGQIRDGASVSDSERQIVADMEAILSWMGIEGQDGRLDTWLGMSLEERREHHEKFARGFERYLMEGKAPSQELQGLFSRFRSWLVSVYKALAGLNVDLSDEVRQVMDRMLATDEAIAEAQAARDMGPLFASPEQAGMSPAEYAEYQGLAARQTAEATAELDARLMKDMKWLDKARSKALKAAQDEAADLRREVRREVSAEVMSTPIYQAWQILTGKGELSLPGTGAPITPESSLRLRTKLVKEISQDAWSKLSERRMTSEERGWDPDIIAEALGFTSGDQLVNQLARVQPPSQVIDELTDRVMLERHGDITSPEALARAADEAIHNEVRARVVAAELRAMEKANRVRAGERSTVNVLARAARDYAYAAIAALRVRDIRPTQYSAAAARAGKLAQQALGKSTAEVALHKRNQLINTQAARAAHEALAEVKALQAYFRKFDKRVESIPPDYQDQIDALLERFDFKPASLKAIDRRKAFAEWYAEQEAAGNPPDVPDYLLEESARKSFKDMTVEELRGLRDTVKQIEHQGRLKKKLLLARDKREFEAIAIELAAGIEASGGEPRDVNLEPPTDMVGKTREWFAGAWASHRKLASLFRQFDGNRDAGPAFEHIGRAMNERSTMEDTMLEAATVKLAEFYAPLLKLRGGLTGARSKVYIPEIAGSLTRGGRLAVALNWGNPDNRQRLLDGNKWTQGQVQAVLRTLSTQELAFVNQVWEFLDSYWPEIAAKEKRLTGVEPAKVQAAPFVTRAADGTEVAMRGGYYPIKYDTDRSDRADTQEAAQAAKEMMQGAVTRATTRRGHTKERVKEVKRAVRLDLNVITQHVTQVVHDLAWHEWLIDTNRLLRDDRVVKAIREHYGPKVLKTIRDDVLGIATADVVPQTDVDKALLMLRTNVTRATMGASVTTAFLQPFGLTQSMVRIGPRHVLRGVARWGGDAVRMESTLAWIYGKSEFMRLRAKTFNRELREIQAGVAGKSKAMKMVDAGLFVFMRKMQTVADVPTWVGQYEKSLAEGLPDADAVAMADRAVLESQGGGAVKDLAEVQRKHPMLTQFYSYFSVTLNLTAESTAATDFKNLRAVAGWLGDMALLLVIPAILPSLLLYGLRGGDEDDEKGMAKRMLEWQLSYLMGMVVGAREFSGLVSGFDYAGPPVGRIVADVGKAGKQTMQGEVDEPMVKAWIRLLGDAFGIPTTQALRSWNGWKAWDEGEGGPVNVLLGPPAKD